MQAKRKQRATNDCTLPPGRVQTQKYRMVLTNDERDINLRSGFGTLLLFLH